MLRVIVNGKETSVPERGTVRALLEDLDLERDGIAVEINRRLIPRRLHGETRLEEGDEVEIVTFVGGG